MKVTAGERAVHISLSYDQASILEEMIELVEIDVLSEMWVLKQALTKSRGEGLAKGFPRPPLPKGNPSWPVIRRPEDPEPCEHCHGSGQSVTQSADLEMTDGRQAKQGSSAGPLQEHERRS